MNSKKFLSYGALAVGSLIGLAGIAFVAMYVLEAIFARLGEPDQSLLFWYLPILFIGLFGIITGATTGILGYVGLRKISREETTQKIDN